MKGVSTEPRKQLIQDFQQHVQECLSDGDQLVIGADLNDDSQTVAFAKMLQSLGLVDTITTLHGNKAPNTYQYGSRPIDSIFVTPSLVGIRAG